MAPPPGAGQELANAVLINPLYGICYHNILFHLYTLSIHTPGAGPAGQSCAHKSSDDIHHHDILFH